MSESLSLAPMMKNEVTTQHISSEGKFILTSMIFSP